jgi:hypothetical protein
MRILIVLFSFITIWGCADSNQVEYITNELRLERTAEFKLKNQTNGIRSILQGLLTDKENERIYGIDFRSRRLYAINVNNQTIDFISSVGSGPNEFVLPIQIAFSDGNLLVYDNSADRITVLDENKNMIYEAEGTLKHGVWTRGTYAFFRNDYFIASMKEAALINTLDFESAKAVSILNIKTGEIQKAGQLPANIDRLDSFQKYPLLAYNPDNDSIYYVFFTWPDIHKLDLKTLVSEVKSTYTPSFMRQRTIVVDFNNPELQTIEFAKKIGEDRTELVTLDFINGYLISTWQNYTKEYFDSIDPNAIEYFGVRYSYPGFDNPREFSIPGLPLGVYGGKLMILDNDDPLEFVIGLYEFINE